MHKHKWYGIPIRIRTLIISESYTANAKLTTTHSPFSLSSLFKFLPFPFDSAFLIVVPISQFSIHLPTNPSMLQGKFCL